MALAVTDDLRRLVQELLFAHELAVRVFGWTRVSGPSVVDRLSSRFRSAVVRCSGNNLTTVCNDLCSFSTISGRRCAVSAASASIQLRWGESWWRPRPSGSWARPPCALVAIWSIVGESRESADCWAYCLSTPAGWFRSRRWWHGCGTRRSRSIRDRLFIPISAISARRCARTRLRRYCGYRMDNSCWKWTSPRSTITGSANSSPRRGVRSAPVSWRGRWLSSTVPSRCGADFRWLIWRVHVQMHGARSSCTTCGYRPISSRSGPASQARASTMRWSGSMNCRRIIRVIYPWSCCAYRRSSDLIDRRKRSHTICRCTSISEGSLMITLLIDYGSTTTRS